MWRTQRKIARGEPKMEIRKSNFARSRAEPFEVQGKLKLSLYKRVTDQLGRKAR